jgi:hypothetical protein
VNFHVNLNFSKFNKSAFVGERTIYTAIALLMPCNYYPPPKAQAGVPPLLACPRLIIQHIRSYPPHLKAVFAIRNLKSPMP